MSEKKINLKEIYDKVIEERFRGDEQAIRIYKLTGTETDLMAMKEACRQTLELAAENARTNKEIMPTGVLKSIGTVNKQSILDTIKQIE